MTDTMDNCAPKSQELALRSFLPFQLLVISEHVNRCFARVYGARFDLSLAEWQVLAVLGERGAATSTDIKLDCFMHKTKISRAVAALESRGLLTRRTSQSDLRVAHLSLTSRGRRMHEELIPLARTFTDGILAGLPPEQREALDAALATLKSQAEAVAEEMRESDS